MGNYRIRVEKDYTVFSAAHFITYDGHECEALHGHNYRVAASLTGQLDENAYVFNFGPLKHALRDILGRLDHKLLLPQNNPLLVLETDAESVCAAYAHKRYVFPREDVVLLPIPNTTAEMLAAWLCAQLRPALGEFDTRHLTSIEIEVEESFGQRAIYCEEWK
ncbi:MAG TPA: 6-carboxytetrahydropterin synthase [Anaerolineae bacterium]|nr:6-carboxytetrahydropterin synthase [Anaerolineae bacterium]